MDAQPFKIILKAYEMIKKDQPLTDKERSYLVGSLETLIVMYSADNSSEGLSDGHKSLVQKLFS